MGLLGKLDRRNSTWAARKIASEKRRPPDNSFPVISTPNGLFTVSVVDLESERIRARYAITPDFVVLLLAAMVFVAWLIKKRKRPSKPRYEARVISLGYPRERRVAGTAFATRAEAQVMQRRYEEELRRGWNPADSASQLLTIPPPSLPERYIG